MWEYKREEARIGSYTPSQFMELLNNYGKEDWELVDYWEHKGLNGNHAFRVVMKRKRVRV
jgi:hypothetical protein